MPTTSHQAPPPLAGIADQTSSLTRSRSCSSAAQTPPPQQAADQMAGLARVLSDSQLKKILRPRYGRPDHARRIYGREQGSFSVLVIETLCRSLSPRWPHRLHLASSVSQTSWSHTHRVHNGRSGP